MSQLFNLQLASDTLLTDAAKLGVSCEQLKQIRVKVSVTLVQRSNPELQLDYQVHLPSTALTMQLDWPTWQKQHVNFTDYLWEQTCLECFIGSRFTDDGNTRGYVEINASPSGQYALYKFDNYRTPSTLPPVPLLESDGYTRAHITWAEHLTTTQSASTNMLNLAPRSINAIHTSTPLIFTPYYQYRRCFKVSLDQITFNSSSDDCSDNIGFDLLHPCVILRLDHIYLYFAPIHTSPPDFHERRYWSKLDYQAALSS